MALRTMLNLGLMATLTKQIASDEYANHPLDEMWSFDWQTGTGEGQANSLYHASGTVGAGLSVNKDLIGGGLVDAFGDAIAFTTVRAILIRNTSSGEINLTVQSTLPIFATGSDSLVIPAGGCVVFASAAGWTVTAGTADVLTLTAPTEEAGYELIIIGAR